jgi:hypothetical protein
MTRWLPVSGYEGQYEVSDLGKVRSIDREVVRRYRTGKVISYPLCGHTLKPVAGNGRNAYASVLLSKKGKVKRFLIHRLVLETFIGPPETGQEGCHCDGNGKNNRLDNLRWDDRIGNAADMARHGRAKGSKHHAAKLTEAKVRAIRRSYGVGKGTSVLALKYGVSHTTIRRVLQRTGWSHVA